MYGKLQMKRKNDIEDLKKNVKILIVDDDKPAILEYLEYRKYDVYYKSDMTYAIEADPFDIVLMDIRGVATQRGSSMEGFELATEIKKESPLKKVAVYSGSTVHVEVTSRRDEVDEFIPRDAEPDSFCEIIDNMIIEYLDYEKQWDVIYSILRENDLDDKKIRRIRKSYIKSFKTRNMNDLMKLNRTVTDNIKDASVLINIISSIITLAKVIIV